MNITYSKHLTAVVRALGLQALLSRCRSKPRNVLGICCRFGGHVITCEPEPIALQPLTANREVNRLDFQIISNALSDEEKEVSFFFPTSDQIVQNSHIPELGTCAVKCIPGDSLKLHPGIVKIDVEGHEIHVLRGLRSSLDLCRLCVVEVHEGVEWSAVERELRSCQFTGFERLHGKLVGRR